MNDNPPNKTVIPNTGVRKWAPPTHKPSVTMSTEAYKPYSTYVLDVYPIRLGSRCTNMIQSVVSKYTAWDPKAKVRE